MRGSIDLDTGPHHDVVTNVHLVTVQNGTQDIQIDVIADVDVLTVGALEWWLNDRMPTNLPQQSPEDGLTLRHGFGQIVKPE